MFDCRSPQANNAPIKNKRILLERVEKFISPTYFSDVNLYSRLYKEKSACSFLGHVSVGNERFSKYDDVVKEAFTPVKLGSSYGPSWTTHWFKIQFNIPENWINQEVRFRWNSASEAMVWKDGVPLQGLTGGDGQVRSDFIVTSKARRPGSITLYVEMAANGMFGVGKDGLINPPDPNRTFTLSMAEFAVFDRNIFAVISDLEILIGMVKELPDDSQRAWQALYTANDVVNCFQPPGDDSQSRAFRILNQFFDQKNGDSQHTVHAVGHCHIDCAWLWPYAESIRKCGRSWASTIRLMKSYPQFKFACSQAQQFDWVRKNYPSIYEEIKTYVHKGQFLPVGGTWVEMDGYIPSGESFVRQFLYGQKFFESEFGKKCSVFWLPDTFGYSAQLPQIIKQCGMKYFVTQKLSWNLINKFPHNTFQWEGIDGTRCLTHFPPADTYESSAGANDVLKSSTKNKDMGRVNDSLLLFGYGDGGGGPTEDMIEKLQRMGDVDGLPRVEFSSPEVMFQEVEKNVANLNVWVGELYLELHQGTLTTNSMVKKSNKLCECILRFAEFLATVAWIDGNRKPDLYPTAGLNEKWKLLLLNQFHDVLPGTSIHDVYVDAERHYEDIIRSSSSFVQKALQEISPKGKPALEMINRCCLINTCSWSRREVVQLCQETALATKESEIDDDLYQNIRDDERLGFFEVPSMGFAPLKPLPVPHPAEIKIVDDVVCLSNGLLESRFNKTGHLLSLKLVSCDREAIAKPMVGNQLVIHDDMPLFWDAWDIMPFYKQTRKPLNDLYDFEILERGPLRVKFKAVIRVSDKSSIEQEISLCAASEYIRIDIHPNWNENRKLLRVEFPVNVHASFTTQEIQFGHVQRPNHANTSWDWAKYEVCGHNWVDVSEHDFGVALMSPCKYGYSFEGNVMGISLLRSPKSPDDILPDNMPDIGLNSFGSNFSYSIMPHKGSFQSAGVIQQGYNLSTPIFTRQTEIKDSLLSKPLFSVASPAVILQTVKKAEDLADAVVIRLYEAYGGRATTNFNCEFPVKGVSRCNMLEEPFEMGEFSEIAWNERTGCELRFKPFEIMTLILHLN